MQDNNSCAGKVLRPGLEEAIEHFSEREACFESVQALRWPDGVHCPHCVRQGIVNKDVHFTKTCRIWRCRVCKKQFSIKVGTILEDSPLSLKIWLSAIWLIANTENAVSAGELADHLQIRETTASLVLQRIAAALRAGTSEMKNVNAEAHIP